MFGCFLFMFDNLNLIESRLILIDSQLIFYCALALWFALVYWQRWRDHEDAVLIREYGNRFSTTAVHSDQELDAIAGGVLDGIEEDEKDSDDEDLGGSSQAATSTTSATSAAPTRTGASDASGASVYSERERMRIGLHRLDDMLHNGLGSLGFRVPIPVRSSTSLAVAEAVRAWSRPAATQRPRELTLTERLLWSVGLGLVCGAAVSIKWTALATPGMIAVECFFGFFFLRESIPILDLLVTAFSAFVLYAWNFWVHFKLLPYHGDGDAFMSLEFQRKIVNNTHYDPNAPELPFLTKLWQLNAEMLSANARIDTPHHWMSKWHSWPLNQRGVLYYSHTRPDGHSEVVYLLGNPAVIWFVGIAVLVGFVALFIYLRVRNEPDLRFPAGFRGFLNSIFYASITYLLNLLPYILVSRSAFVYHYMVRAPTAPSASVDPTTPPLSLPVPLCPSLSLSASSLWSTPTPPTHRLLSPPSACFSLPAAGPDVRRNHGRAHDGLGDGQKRAVRDENSLPHHLHRLALLLALGVLHRPLRRRTPAPPLAQDLGLGAPPAHGGGGCGTRNDEEDGEDEEGE